MSPGARIGIVAIAFALIALGWRIGRHDPVTPPPPDTTPVRVIPASPTPASAPTSPSVPPASPTPQPTDAASSPPPQDDEIAANLPPLDSDPRQLHARFRAEARDAAWAGRRETELHRAFADIPNIGGSDPLNVRCATTICEASGTYPPDLPLDAARGVMSGLQSRQLSDRAEALGLDQTSSSFSSAHDRPNFLIFFRRR
jgi:hypothetical protein